MCHWENIDQQTWRRSDYVIMQVTENYTKAPGNSQLKAGKGQKGQESRKVISVQMGILNNICMRCDSFLFPTQVLSEMRWVLLH